VRENAPIPTHRRWSKTWRTADPAAVSQVRAEGTNITRADSTQGADVSIDPRRALNSTTAALTHTHR